MQDIETQVRFNPRSWWDHHRSRGDKNDQWNTFSTRHAHHTFHKKDEDTDLGNIEPYFPLDSYLTVVSVGTVLLSVYHGIKHSPKTQLKTANIYYRIDFLEIRNSRAARLSSSGSGFAVMLHSSWRLGWKFHKGSGESHLCVPPIAGGSSSLPRWPHPRAVHTASAPGFLDVGKRETGWEGGTVRCKP